MTIYYSASWLVGPSALISFDLPHGSVGVARTPGSLYVETMYSIRLC